ncbi:MAG: putative DNA binding domain-containing protein [Lentimicrobium sp.]|jgi:ATP-dependent DNA helicase RecG|nr:putative DNA binding domain-containing protein [Lentimicrobium sp.]
MKEAELKEYLKTNYPFENEKCEWKEFKFLKNSVAGNKGDDIISYISAISNMNGGNLIIGVKDKTLNIVGITDFGGYTIENIKFRVLGNCPNLNSEGFSVEEIFCIDTNKVVWIFHIPKHQYRLPVYAHKKAWQRIDDNLIEISQPRLDSILNELKQTDDWTAVVVNEATIDDLDETAIEKAKKEFIKRNPKYLDEIKSWDNGKFLDKAKLTIKGKITRTALILLGRDESEHFLGSFVKIRWNLKMLNNQDKDFEIFSIPFLLNIDEVYLKIRNLKYRYLPDGTLFPEEVLRYDPFNIREPLNNAIAHQDYTAKGRINVIEFEDDHLIFSNCGTFLPKSVEEVVMSDSPEEVYRNPFLVSAMKNLGMIETQGGGIRKIFNFQRQRCFPLPDYDLNDNKVKVTITGKILNEDFARILKKNPDLSLEDIILLDKVQKRKPINENELSYLRKRGFVEGRRTNVFLSLKVIDPTKDEGLIAEYITNKSFDDTHFKKMIVEYINKGGQVKRKSIDNLIIPKLSPTLTELQKKHKVTNFLTALRIENKIISNSYGTWESLNEFKRV